MFFKISELVNILKISDEDLRYITGLKNIKESLKKYRIKTIL